MVDQLIIPNWHVVLIHYPLGLVGVGVALEILTLIWPRREARSAGRVMILLGALLALPAAFAGVHALRDVLVPGPAGADTALHTLISEAGWTETQWRLVERHIWLSSLATAAVLLAAGVWSGLPRAARRGGYVFCLLAVVAGLGLFGAAAWYGGEMIYRTGIAVETGGESAQRAGLEWLIPPLQLHVVVAGVTTALAVWAVLLLLASRGQHTARTSSHGEPGLLLDGPVPVRTGPPASSSGGSGAVAWWLAAAAALATILAGFWVVLSGGEGSGLLDNLSLLFSGARWRLTLHVLAGLAIFALPVAMALAARRRAKPGTMFVMSGALGLVLALQVWLGVLLLFDSHHGPVTGFREPRASAGASHEGHRHGAAGEQAAVTVRMTDTLKYEPREVTIAAGETVTWDNSSGVVHTVTADPAKAANEDHVKLPEGGEPFDSGDIPPGATWSRTFEVPGDYRYFCIPHEMAGMVGTVHVKAR